MRLDRFTERSQEVLQAAQQAAQTLHHPLVHPLVDSEHLLLALLGQPEGVAPALLRRLNVSPEPVSAQLQALLVDARSSTAEVSRASARSCAIC
jgi:ATP-dependent Clp protease ATP-binding subunit ClpB